ncbi:MAG TPA: hypothetical protein VHV50_04470 [Actinomycetota bacterium]|jgi:hypothetical protein|nr:hypothetical protein [Actinomycetota bacterium]
MGLTRPKPAPKTRSNFERHIYSVEAAVTDVLQEDDQDFHVVLRDGPAHMVAESPNAPFFSSLPLVSRISDPSVVEKLRRIVGAE